MKKRFQKVYIEITNRCNLKCPICFASSNESIKELLLTAETFIFFNLFSYARFSPILFFYWNFNVEKWCILLATKDIAFTEGTGWSESVDCEFDCKAWVKFYECCKSFIWNTVKFLYCFRCKCAGFLYKFVFFFFSEDNIKSDSVCTLLSA